MRRKVVTNEMLIEMEVSEAILTKLNTHLVTLLDRLAPEQREVLHIGPVAEKLADVQKDVAGRLSAVTWEIDRTNKLLRGEET